MLCPSLQGCFPQKSNLLLLLAENIFVHLIYTLYSIIAMNIDNKCTSEQVTVEAIEVIGFFRLYPLEVDAQWST